MTLDDAKQRVRRIAERRIEKAEAYAAASREYEVRATSPNEVLHASQREFLTSLGMSAAHNAETMRADAEALVLVLESMRK